jgi:hypothetical protein
MDQLRDLQVLLDKVVDPGGWAGAAGFLRRCDVLDLLEVHLAELSRTPPSTRALHLSQRAMALHAALESDNDAHVRHLRAEVSSGRLRGASLLRELEQYTPAGAAASPEENPGYDALDLLVAGLLGTGGEAAGACVEAHEEMVGYQPTPARLVLELARRATLGPHGTLVDVGSGLGVVPILVSLVTGARCMGLELQPAYCNHATTTALELNISGVEFVCGDAREADFSLGTVFYMYTPFKGAVLDHVLQRLHAQALQRRISLFTHGPYLAQALRQPSLALEEDPPGGGALTVFRSRPR